MSIVKKLTREQKMQLGELLAVGHRHFGKVAPRRPYVEEDEDGGSGGSSKLLLDHPLFMDAPTGATSDLTFLVNENNHAIEEAEKRSDELNPQLRKVLENQLGHQLNYQPPRAPKASML